MFTVARRSSLCGLVLVLAFLGMAPRAAEAQLTITSNANLGTWSVGVVDAGRLSATGGSTTTYTWTIVAGSLPPGLSLRTDLPSYITDPTVTAGIIGVATTPGTYPFTLRVTNN